MKRFQLIVLLQHGETDRDFLSFGASSGLHQVGDGSVARVIKESSHPRLLRSGGTEAIVSFDRPHFLPSAVVIRWMVVLVFRLFQFHLPII